MAISFIHLSDIHFGQERGGEVIVHNDVKERLIEDAGKESAKLGDPVGAILLTGDVAFAGKRAEYFAAGQWLDRLAEAVGCQRTAVQVVPGNHDIDRSEISAGCAGSGTVERCP